MLSISSYFCQFIVFSVYHMISGLSSEYLAIGFSIKVGLAASAALGLFYFKNCALFYCIYNYIII